MRRRGTTRKCSWCCQTTTTSRQSAAWERRPPFARSALFAVVFAVLGWDEREMNDSAN